MEETKKCWSCGGVMVIKDGDRGKFYECNNQFCGATDTVLIKTGVSPLGTPVQRPDGIGKGSTRVNTSRPIRKKK
ncbi:MAG: hypothetical protein V1767_01060 [Chloroflexota bacterium]